VKDQRAWWLPLIQGLIAVALGLFLLFARTTAVTWIGTAAALYMFVAGLLLLGGVLFSSRRSLDSWQGIQGIAGLVIGGGLLAVSLFDLTDLTTSFTLLAVGLIVFGGLGVGAGLFGARGTIFRLPMLIINGLLLLWGVLVLFSRNQGFDLALIGAIILLVLGVVLIISAFLARGKDADAAAAST
jgi:uncharacterized membrane protein HdeD (DUF308 family)